MRHEHVQRLGRVLSVHGELRRRRRAVAHADVVIVVVHGFGGDAALRFRGVSDAGADTCADADADACADPGADARSDHCTHRRTDARAD